MEYVVHKTEQSGGRECGFNLGLGGLRLFETMFIKQTRILKFKKVGEQDIIIRLQNQYSTLHLCVLPAAPGYSTAEGGRTC